MKSSEIEKIELKKRLARVLRQPRNKICADCPETRPTWISFIKPQQNFALGSKNLATFVCLQCAGLHRKLGTHICVVRSISHDQFEKKDVECAENSGNDVVNEIFEGHLQKSTMDGISIKPLLGAEVARRERFIRQKYVDLHFYRKRAHYQHISGVNKMISGSSTSPSKPSTSPSKPMGIKSSPKVSRKKLSIFLHEDNSVTNGKDTKTSGCSTTVGNTTMTPSSTSRTRTISDRDDSYKSRDRLSVERRSSKRRSSKSSGTSTSRKKGQRRLKTKDQNDFITRTSPSEDRVDRSSEISTPCTSKNTPNHRENSKSRSPTNIGMNLRNSKGGDELTGMILVFDEDACDSIESPRRKSKNSSRGLDRGRRNSPINKVIAKNPSIDTPNLQNYHLEDFKKNPLVKTTSEKCDTKDSLRTSFKDLRRSRSGITIDDILKNRGGSISPAVVRKNSICKNKTMGPEATVNRTSNNRSLPNEQGHEIKSITLKRLSVKSPSYGLTTQLKAHLNKGRNLKNPYLESALMSPLSVEGIVSEETSYGFGDNTIHNMSGTGESNIASSTEGSITEDGFRVIHAGNSSDDIIANLKRAADHTESKNSSKSVSNKLNKKDRKSTSSQASNRKHRKSTSSQASRKKTRKSTSSQASNKYGANTSSDDPSLQRLHQRRSKSEPQISRTSEPSKKRRSSKKRSKSKNPRSRERKSEKEQNLRTQTLFDEWEKLKSENHRGWEKLKNENQRKFTELDDIWSRFHASF